MEFHFLLVFTFTLVALVVSHAAPASEVYWQSVLPKAPMPKAVRDLLPAEQHRDSIDVKNSNTNADSRNLGSMGFKDNAASVEVGGVSVDFSHKENPNLRVLPPYSEGEPWEPFLYKYAG